MKIVKSLVALSGLASSVEAKPAFSASGIATTLRGGAGPLDSDVVAKFATGTLFANSVVEILSPKKTTELYGLSLDSMNDYLIERIGIAQLSLALAGYKVAIQGAGLNDAIGISSIPWLVTHAKALLNDTTGKLGIKPVGEYVSLAIAAVVAHACLTGAKHADDAVKYLGFWLVANGLLCGLAPEKACEAWGNPISGRDKSHLIRVLGSSVGSLGVLIVAMNQGVDVMQALGYAIVPFFALIASSLFVTKDVDGLGMNKGGHYFWLIAFAAEVITLAFPKEAAAAPAT